MDRLSFTGLAPHERVPVLIGWLSGSGHVLAKAVRFTIVGVLSGLIYSAATALCIVVLAVSPVPASLIGYCASVPMSFLGHRRFSFRANGHWTMEAIRFVCSQVVNMTVTAGAMHAAVDRFGLAYFWGMAGTVILVPIANFAFMNFWVFRDQDHAKGARR